jgi:hypothetical protein
MRVPWHVPAGTRSGVSRAVSGELADLWSKPLATPIKLLERLVVQ